jgi:hypothetical protein
MAASRNADVTKNKFKNRLPLPFSSPLFPLRWVEGINVRFWTAAGSPKTYVYILYPTKGKEGRGKGEGKPFLKSISL